MVDLCCYNEVFLEDATTTRMMVALVLFDSVVNSQWFMRTSIILFLTNASRFKQKLDKDPLGNYFPDYTGGQ
jgi:guanine nucleotide-binding protein G(i) subunit alpha